MLWKIFCIFLQIQFVTRLIKLVLTSDSKLLDFEILDYSKLFFFKDPGYPGDSNSSKSSCMQSLKLMILP